MTYSLNTFGCLTAIALVLATPVMAQVSLPVSDAETDGTVLDTILVQAAAEELRQALGVSTITATDLARTPVGRDLEELIRTQPGVNLTGNAASGQRGNNRQIDLRGMGPENTMILIDGIPVNSRNAVRMGRQGERDTRGDANWVAPELIDSIEVLRGPAAARYGSGSAGGVVNIITRRPDTAFGTFSSYFSAPEHQEEGGTRRAGLVVGGPLGQNWSQRLSLSGSLTDPDARDINADAAESTNPPAGREGVASFDATALLSGRIDAQNSIDLQFGYARQGNRYAGDTMLSTGGALVDSLAAERAETNVMARGALTLTHRGDYAFGESLSYLQWEHTDNRRLNEGYAGSSEGAIISADEYSTITLDNLNAKTEWNLPQNLWREQMLTLGAELRGEFMNDPTVRQQADMPFEDAPITGIAADRDTAISAWNVALYAESNIRVTEDFTLTPGLRLDQHENFGLNASPSLNASYALGDAWTLRGGVARAFKAPNLFQLNPNYLWNSRGRGCDGYAGTSTDPAAANLGCVVVGNPDLDAEQSTNLEFGIAYDGANGVQGTLTYFHNDYDQRVQAGVAPLVNRPMANGRTYVFQWENMGPAVIAGLEGSLTLPLSDSLSLTANFTRMLESEIKATGAPLSLVPDYTVNAALRWQASDDLGLTLSTTSYGAISPRDVDFFGNVLTTEPAAREAYTLVNIATDFAIGEDVAITAGINNLADKRLFRTGDGAESFNEAGRSIYVGVNASF